MRAFVALLSIAVSSVLPATAIGDSGMPEGSFTCQVLMVDRLTGTSGDRFVPSVLGTFSFDGLGHYIRQGKTGGIDRRGAQITFVSGEAEGMRRAGWPVSYGAGARVARRCRSDWSAFCSLP